MVRRRFLICRKCSRFLAFATAEAIATLILCFLVFSHQILRFSSATFSLASSNPCTRLRSWSIQLPSCWRAQGCWICRVLSQSNTLRSWNTPVPCSSLWLLLVDSLQPLISASETQKAYPVFPKVDFTMMSPAVKDYLHNTCPEVKNILLCGMEVVFSCYRYE